MAIVSFRTSESITAGQAVFVNQNGLASRTNALSFDSSSVAGIALDTAAAGSLIRVNTDAIYTSTSSFTPGEIQYLSPTSSGAYGSYEIVSSGIGNTAYAGFYLTTVGQALTATKLSIELGRPTFIENTTSVFLLENSGVDPIDAILQEDGSTIKLESAA